MNVLMATNTYLPHVGGVARSVASFREELQLRGHKVLVLAPEFDGRPANEEGVIRVPAIQNFNGSDFSVSLPLTPLLLAAIDHFEPDIVHAHHPFLLGATALRLAALRGVPLVFTYHTMYERYTHYVPGDSPALKKFAVQLSAGYCNLCQHVIAPSESIARILRKRGVETPISSIPTGVNLSALAFGDRSGFRRRFGLPGDAFVVGHVGRLAPEKNLAFLARAGARFVRMLPDAFFLIVGSGPEAETIKEIFRRNRAGSRLVLPGTLEGRDLIDSFYAIDAFAFASQTETQGMVLAEAMAAGVPVVAVDAPGVREIIADHKNGRLLRRENEKEFAKALLWIAEASPSVKSALRKNCLKSAELFSISRCTNRLEAVYQELLASAIPNRDIDNSSWTASLRLIQNEWELFEARAQAAGEALTRTALFQRRCFKRARAVVRLLRRWRRQERLAIKLLGLQTYEHCENEPGLVMIQIDGLGRRCLEQGIRQRRLPFLRRLLNRSEYRLFSLYSGMPSSTPAVQGELFYGQRCAVPAFGFFERAEHRIAAMFEQGPASRIEQKLQSCGEGLLAGGSSSSNIYTGGAVESRFCPSSFGWSGVFKMLNPFSLSVVALTRLGTVIRVALLLVFEVVLACIDALAGIAGGRNARKEARCALSRVLIVIFLRELITLAAELDIARGVPIVHLNYVGYDEQAHRRGPSSQFALWSLPGIDSAIRRLFAAAKKSRRRRYEVWVHSDHGQELSTPYEALTGKPVETAIRELYFSLINEKETRFCESVSRSVEAQREAWIFGRATESKQFAGTDGTDECRQPIHVAAMGPIGSVYLEEQHDFQFVSKFAALIVSKGRVPLVLFRSGGRAFAVDEQGMHDFKSAAERILGPSKFQQEIKRDLERILRHPLSGELTILGWQRGRPSISFPQERGSHGGPGPEETHAFLLVPRTRAAALASKDYLRPIDLRNAVLEYLGRTAEDKSKKQAAAG